MTPMVRPPRPLSFTAPCGLEIEVPVPSVAVGDEHDGGDRRCRVNSDAARHDALPERTVAVGVDVVDRWIRALSVVSGWTETDLGASSNERELCPRELRGERRDRLARLGARRSCRSTWTSRPRETIAGGVFASAIGWP